MIDLPDEHELISFFQTLPSLADPQEPWAYNHVTFRSRSEDDRAEVTFEMSPSYAVVKITWEERGRNRAHLLLDHVGTLSVDSREDRLVMTFEDAVGLGPLRLGLRPHVSLFWDARTE
jgi:hypothetical protein